MFLVCPLCNGLYEIQQKCFICNNDMVDRGPIVNYLDDYSPYLLDDITTLVDGVEKEKCVHLFYCNNCNYDKRVVISKKEI